MPSTTTSSTLKQFARDFNFDGQTVRDDRVATRAIAAALERVSKDRRWSHLRETKRIATTADKTGTVSVNVAGTTITPGTLSLASTDVGSFIEFNGEQIWYELASTTTIVDAYQGSGNLSAVNCVVVKAAIDLPANFKEIYKLVPLTDGDTGISDIDGETMEELHAQYAGPARPHSYAIRTTRGGNSKQLWLYPAPDAVYQYQLLYYFRPGYLDISASNVWVLDPTADGDIVTWPDDEIPLLRRAIKMCCAEEMGLTGQYDLARRAYSEELYKSMASDNDKGETMQLGLPAKRGGWGVIGSQYNV